MRKTVDGSSIEAADFKGSEFVTLHVEGRLKSGEQRVSSREPVPGPATRRTPHFDGVNLNEIDFASFGAMVTVWSSAPKYSCQASIV